MESTCQRGTLVLPLFSLCLFFVAGVVAHAHDQDTFATCIIQPLGVSGKNISGVIKLMESGTTGNTTLVGHLYGFSNETGNKRGFHVHVTPNLSNNCDAAGPHYNPLNKSHGAPSDTERHVGDLGNIVVDSNLESSINITDNVISLHGNYSIVNRALVVHSGEDDLGRGGNETSKTTGNSGYRIGCCIITLDQQTTAAPAPTQTTTAGATSAGPLTGILFICLAGSQLLMKNIKI